MLKQDVVQVQSLRPEVARHAATPGILSLWNRVCSFIEAFARKVGSGITRGGEGFTAVHKTEEKTTSIGVGVGPYSDASRVECLMLIAEADDAGLLTRRGDDAMDVLRTVVFEMDSRHWLIGWETAYFSRQDRIITG